jgi:hypothetical protein
MTAPAMNIFPGNKVLPVQPVHFPQNIINLLADRFRLADPTIDVLLRPIRTVDRDFTIGLVAGVWRPDEQSYEIGHAFPSAPTLGRYNVTVQALIADADEPRGLERHSAMSDAIRMMLYRDTPLRVGLSKLKVVDSQGVVVESAQRWGVKTQNFLNQSTRSTYLYLSTLDFWLETEVR